LNQEESTFHLPYEGDALVFQAPGGKRAGAAVDY
jgi:hypothetical protein